MEFKQYLKTYEGLQIVNKYNFLVLALLVVVLFIVSIMALENKERVVLQPYTLTEDAWVTDKDASKGYKEAWALFLAQMIGNVNPSNVDFVGNRIKPMLSPRVYNDVVDDMNLQAENIRLDRIVYRFEPKEVIYEAVTDKVFVFGDSVVRSADGEDQRTQRTFEFIIGINNFSPVISHLSSNRGRPRDQRTLQQEQARERAENGGGQ